MNAVAMNTTHLNAKEAAAMIRAALKVAFPGFKFSVRSEYFSGGSAVNVRFTDGPKTADVEMIAGQFGSRGGCDQFDCPTYESGDLRLTVDGDLVQYSYRGFVSVTRDFSPAVEAAMDARFEAETEPDAYPNYGSYGQPSRDEARNAYKYHFAYDKAGKVLA